MNKHLLFLHEKTFCSWMSCSIFKMLHHRSLVDIPLKYCLRVCTADAMCIDTPDYCWQWLLHSRRDPERRNHVHGDFDKATEQEQRYFSLLANVIVEVQIRFLKSPLRLHENTMIPFVSDGGYVHALRPGSRRRLDGHLDPLFPLHPPRVGDEDVVVRTERLRVGHFHRRYQVLTEELRQQPAQDHWTVDHDIRSLRRAATTASTGPLNGGPWYQQSLRKSCGESQHRTTEQ